MNIFGEDEMKKVLILYGSPNNIGNTATLGIKFKQGLIDGGIHDGQEFWLNDLFIKPCQES